MTELTAASPQDVQLDNAKGVYTMHIDSRNLDSNSLLGKALDQIDADNDGKIEQVCLPRIIWTPSVGCRCVRCCPAPGWRRRRFGGYVLMSKRRQADVLSHSTPHPPLPLHLPTVYLPQT